MSSPKKLVIAGLSATALVASIGYAFAQSTDDSAMANTNWNGAQNSTEDANGANAGAPAMPPAAVSAYNAEIGAAGDQSMAAADPAMSTGSAMNTESSTTTSAGTSSSAMGAADNSTSPWSAPSQGSTTTDPNAGTMGAANPTAGTSPEKTDLSHPAVEPQGSAATNPGMTSNTMATPAPSSATGTTAAPSSATATTQTETRVDLNSPNEPQYNLASDPWLRHGSNARQNSSDNANGVSATGDSGTGTTGERAPRADRN